MADGIECGYIIMQMLKMFLKLPPSLVPENEFVT